MSAVFDVTGDGKQKLAAYYGRYYDPIRMDMTNFTGSLSGYVREEQTYDNVLNQWVTYRTRGGPVQADGFFAPATKTPYTDEFQLQYETDLGHNISGSVTYYRRQTRDIFEDFDPTIYTIPEAYGGDINAPNSLFLGYEYFGFDPNNPPAANFFLATLEGGERNYNGLEFVARKRFSDRWQGMASYNYLDAKGNAVSDGNADFAGDVLWLDPRAPNMYGTVPGTIHHIFKMAGSYETKWGVELGGSYRWNSGTVVNKTQLASSRRLPIQVAPSAPTSSAASWTSGWTRPHSAACRIRPTDRRTCASSTSIRSARRPLRCSWTSSTSSTSRPRFGFRTWWPVRAPTRSCPRSHGWARAARSSASASASKHSSFAWFERGSRQGSPFF